MLLSKHLISQIRVYVFLKSKCSGQIKLPKELIELYSKELGFKSSKTFKKHLIWLLANKWITYNSKSGNYHIKGFVAVANKLKFICRKGAIFEPLDFDYFKPFIIAAVIKMYMQLKSRKDGQVYVKGCTRKTALILLLLLYLICTYGRILIFPNL